MDTDFLGELSKIDKYAESPIDYVLSKQASNMLKKAAKLEAIPFLSL